MKRSVDTISNIESIIEKVANRYGVKYDPLAEGAKVLCKHGNIRVLEETNICLDLENGDVLISREPHSCVVKFVEEVNEHGVLLVDGVEDEFYKNTEYYKINNKYEILCRRRCRYDM